MKKFYSLMLVGLAVLGLASCKPQPDPKPVIKEFSMDVKNITATTATVSVERTDDVLYFWDIETAEVWSAVEAGKMAEEYGIADTKAYIKDYLDYIIDDAAAYGEDITYEDLLVKGADSYDFVGLTPSTDWVIYAAKIDVKTGEVVGDIEVGTFKTADVTPSDNKLSITYKDGGAYVTTTNNDPYFFYVESVEEFALTYDGYTDENFAEELETWVTLYSMFGVAEEELVTVGNAAFDVASYLMELSPSGKYVAFAAPYCGLVNGQPAYVVFEETNFNLEEDAPAKVAPAKLAAAKKNKIVKPLFKNYKSLKK